MRLHLHNPPLLVTVDGQPALLLASRGERCYVQVRRGWGLNHLRWIAAHDLAEPADLMSSPPAALALNRRTS